MQTVLRLTLFIGFICHTTYSFSQSENIETVLIKREIGKGNMSSSITPTSNFKVDDENFYKYKGIPTGMDTFQLTFKPYDIKQYYYDRFKLGKITEKELLERLKANTNIDTLSLSKEFIKHRIGVFSGLKDKNKIIILDTNNNFDFSDDKILEFDTTVCFTTKWKVAIDKTPPIDVSYQIYDGFKTVQKTTTLKVLAYCENYTIEDDMVKKLMVYFNNFDYYTTVLNLNEKPYYVEIGDRNETLIIPQNILNDSTIKKENFIYQYHEKFAANGTIYSIEKISRFKDTLYLKNWGKGDCVEGNKLGMKSRPFCKQSLEDAPICLEKLKGKYVLLDFWGTWCQPCIASIPDLKKIRDAFSPNDLEIISIAADNKLEKVKEFVKQHNMNWTHLQQAQNAKETDAMTSIFMVTAFPTTILIDKNGVIIDRGAGSDFVEGLYDKLKKILK